MNMRLAIKFVYSLFSVFFVLNDARSDNYSKWLGPQIHGPIGYYWPEFGGEYYKLEANVYLGKDMKLLKTSDIVTTFEDGQFLLINGNVINSLKVERDKKYIFCTLTLKGHLGTRIVSCIIQVRDGVLKNSIIRVRDGYLLNRKFLTPNVIGDPVQAFYKVPDGVNVPLGKLDIEVVEFITHDGDKGSGGVQRR